MHTCNKAAQYCERVAAPELQTFERQRAPAGFRADGLPLPPRPEALDEQRIDDLIAEALAVHKLEVLRSDELVRL